MPDKNSIGGLIKPEKNRSVLAGKKPDKPKIERVNKGFQVEVGRAAKWDLLVATKKSGADKKTGPELMDEALDYLFDKYLEE